MWEKEKKIFIVSHKLDNFYIHKEIHKYIYNWIIYIYHWIIYILLYIYCIYIQYIHIVYILYVYCIYILYICMYIYCIYCIYCIYIFCIYILCIYIYNSKGWTSDIENSVNESQKLCCMKEVRKKSSYCMTPLYKVLENANLSIVKESDTAAWAQDGWWGDKWAR